ncbi:hypothetical protein P3565_23390, partial [Vibrio parahaemolyticus]|nr:hypothetical protein [Vibrio parahaemolyticus]
NKSTICAIDLQLSPKCSPNTEETFVHLNLLQIMKSITLFFFSKTVKLLMVDDVWQISEFYLKN